MEFLFALGYFIALGGIFMVRLLPQWSYAIPGNLEDTRLFLWNGWWVHQAVSVLHTSPYHTMMLFHPFGSQLISHDFPLWMNLVTFMSQQLGLPLIAASNVWFAASWILAGFCTYGLAREVAGNQAAALAAGTFAMTHSYLLARAMQNWGQFDIYGIALFLWLFVRARGRQTASSFIWAGAALAWTAACHYYFLIYSFLIWLCVAALDISPYVPRIDKRPASGTTRNGLLVLATAAGLIGAAIAIHPSTIQVLGKTVSLLSPENPVFAMWILILAWGMAHFKLSFSRASEKNQSQFQNHLFLVGTAALLLSPLFWESFKLVLAGGYPKQGILWKTHLPGANLLALFMPNPLHALWGPAVSQWFTSRGMNPQEQAAQIGWVCLAVVAVSRIWENNVRARQWLGLAVAATILSMGTHLHLAQYNLWCPLPFYFFRLLPLLGNVRVPERWMAVGEIAWAVVLAMALAQLKNSGSRRWIIPCVTALILVENWPGIPYAAPPPFSPVYERLKELPPGAVLPIPLYIGDSSIGAGSAINNGNFIFPWDHLWAQVAHEKPIMGGYVGRISRKIIDDYKEDPFIHTLLDLEEGKLHNQPAEPAFGEYSIKNFHFSYVLIYPESTDPEALKYVLESLPLELVEKQGPVELYRIRDYRSD